VFPRLQIEATAQGQLSVQTARAFVNITVTRNANCPVFTNFNGQYATAIQDTTLVGSLVLGVSARDADGDVIRYDILAGQDSVAANQVFFLNPFTGVITLSSRLFNNSQNSYRFSVRASDQRINVCTVTAEVFISITRDNIAPQFVNTPYGGTIQESAINGTSITRTTCEDNDRRGNIVYAPSSYSVASAFFTVNPTTGNINLYNAAQLRLHKQSQYNVSSRLSSVPSFS